MVFDRHLEKALNIQNSNPNATNCFGNNQLYGLLLSKQTQIFSAITNTQG